MIDQIQPAQLADWIQSKASIGPTVVLDVREAWELQTASVKADGFALQTMPMQTIPARLDELSREQPIACLCHHGGRSAQVTYFLMNQGFSQVVNVHGGIHAWSQEVDPTVPVY